MVCLPFFCRYWKSPAGVSFATRKDGGFSREETSALRQLQAPLARLVESETLHTNTVQVLSTYVGRDAGERVLTGNIPRGTTETIPAIVLFVDLIDFTSQSILLPAAKVVELLNRFFQALDTAIATHGGEILKFIGDGALVIFQTPDDYSAQMAAAAEALAALKDAYKAMAVKNAGNDDGLPLQKFRASLHVGDVHYGNIGSLKRLDFTVIGPTVNLASRLISKGGELNENVVCSEEFKSLITIPSRSLGSHSLKGLETEVAVFGLDVGGVQS
jgi:adenylate cyclase